MSETYTTVQGDMWDSVAYKAMGSEKYAGALMRRNAKYLNFYTLPAGIALNLPEKPVTVNDNLPPWKGAPG